MQTNEFDELVRDKFSQHEFAYNPAHWDKLAGKLEQAEAKGKRKIMGWPLFLALPALKKHLFHLPELGIAAGVALLMAVPFLGNKHPHPAGNGLSKSARRLSPDADLVSRMPIEYRELPASPVTAPIAAFHPATHKRAEQVTPPQPERIAKPAIRETPEEPKETIVIAPQRPRKAYSSTSTDAAPDPAQVYAALRTSLSIAGGFNYSARHTGYAVGFTAKRSFHGRFFIESDVAYVSNRNSKPATSAATLSAGSMARSVNYTNTVAQGATSNTKATPALSVEATQLDYLQVTPTVGYQLQKHLSVGVGADIQRLFRGNEINTEVYTESEVKVLPLTDVGIVAKTEYSISKKLRAGLLYREGMNNVFHSGNGYMNRRYMQVQLKWTILNK